MLISVKGTGKKSDMAWSGDCGGCASVVILFFPKKSLTKIDGCAGALS
jgi:hypothetical protein